MDNKLGLSCIEEFENDSNDDVSDNDTIIYPCIVLTGANTLEELQYFQNRKFNPSTALPLYFNVDGVLTRAGSLDLVLESFLALKNIYEYKVSIYRSSSEEDKIDIDINNPDKLLQFIYLGER